MALTADKFFAKIQHYKITEISMAQWCLLLTLLLVSNSQTDETVVAANGIRKISGKHLLLYTDVRQRADVDELVTVFDLAVPQWCEYFSIDPQISQSWQMRAFVMQDKTRFEQAGLIPADLPEFPAGYQRGNDIWIYLQPGDYYTRHLLLHEGTHAFMERFLGGMGAPWYAEGMAEMLGLNRWQRPLEETGQQLKIGFNVSDRDETPYWGRVKVIRNDVTAETTMTLNDVLHIPGTSFRDVRFYAWAWAGCEFLSKHELSKTQFAEFEQLAGKSLPQFDSQVSVALRDNFDALSRDWNLFIDEMDYGIDVDKIRLIEAKELPGQEDSQPFLIRADHGWQTTTVTVKKGDHLRIQCHSQFQVGKSSIDGVETPWPCTADGITLKYYRGRPLGKLLAGVYNRQAESVDQTMAGLLAPESIGQDAEIAITFDGVLCLRINDSPAHMADNKGALEVTVEKLNVRQSEIRSP